MRVIVFLAMGLAGCSDLTSAQCLNGVLYYRTFDGITPALLPDGEPKTCMPPQANGT